jgi:hypothetical protein
MTDLRSRRFHTLVAGPGYFAAICEEGRAWYKSANSAVWEEVTPLPGIEHRLADDTDPGPPVSLQDMQALADFMAQTGAMFDGFDGPPAPPMTPTESEFLTYDKFEDPLQ